MLNVLDCTEQYKWTTHTHTHTYARACIHTHTHLIIVAIIIVACKASYVAARAEEGSCLLYHDHLHLLFPSSSCIGTFPPWLQRHWFHSGCTRVGLGKRKEWGRKREGRRRERGREGAWEREKEREITHTRARTHAPTRTHTHTHARTCSNILSISSPSPTERTTHKTSIMKDLFFLIVIYVTIVKLLDV